MSKPANAPANRRIEYEVRAIKIVRPYMTSFQLSEKLAFIRNLGKSEPDNPWLKELEAMGLSNYPEKKGKLSRKQLYLLIGAVGVVACVVILYLNFGFGKKLVRLVFS